MLFRGTTPRTVNTHQTDCDHHMTRCSHCLCNSISGSADTVLSLDPFRSGSHNLVRSTTPETSVSRADTAVDPLGSGRLVAGHL